MITRILQIVIVSLVLVSFIVDARIIRSGGRSSEISVFQNTYYIVDDNKFITDPFGNPGLGEDYFDVFDTSRGQTTTDGAYKLLPVPFDGCAENYQPGAYDDVPPEDLPEWNGCEWQFMEGERIFVYADFPMFIPGLFDYKIEFFISDTNSSNTWNFDGDSTYIDPVGGDDLPDGGKSNPGMVYLDSEIPSDLGPGDYLISVIATMFSGPDQTFVHDLEDDFEPTIECEFNAQDEEVCYVADGIEISDTISFGSDFSEKFTILAAEVDIPTPVNSPSTFLLLLASFAALSYRNKK